MSNTVHLGSPSQNQHAVEVQQMFNRIAQRYELMNKLMTLGQDSHWRKVVIKLAQIPQNGFILDIGAGTGDLSREALKEHPTCTPIAADFTLGMMRNGRQHSPGSIHWCAADATFLPFPNEFFDAVISGFLLRNVSDINIAIQEQYRVLKPGGRLVCLDTTRPKPNLLYPAILFHLNTVIPLLGKLITGDKNAYTYLPRSTQNFLTAEQLAEKLNHAQFRQVGFQRYMFGTIAIHWGVKLYDEIK
ncbi:MAG: ubiquinone/menaquinone biosynthesis methyltransferase [Anaerolineales bacterium]